MALHIAAEAGHADIVKYLAENGAEVNAKIWYDQTALHLAAERGHVDVVKCLVENGAQVDAKDKEGTVPLGRARDSDVVKFLKNEHAKNKKINEVRSLAVQFTLANPCCIRVIPYENKDTQSLTVCLYVDTDGNGVPHHVENAAKKEFHNYEVEWVDLRRRPLSKIVTRLPSCRRQKGKEIFNLSRKIEDNLHLFENRLNVTAVCASRKVAEGVEKEIPCVTVFVLGKGKIPAKETNIQKIKEYHGHLFDNAEFDVVEGYYRAAYGPDPWSQMMYVSPLRGGVGIGVNGIPGAGTLGGFLEDEKGKRYILSCDHVLNPPKSRNNALSNDDGPNGVVDDAGTSAALTKDVNNTNYDGSNGVVDDAMMDDGPNEVVHDAGISTGLKEDKNCTKRSPISQVVEQPAKDDHDEMHKKAEKDRKNIEDEYCDVANLSKAEKDDLKKNDEYGKRRLRNFEKEHGKLVQDLQEIKEGAPRRIGEYVDGLKGNVKMKCDNETYSFYVDVAIAKLDERELEFITREKADNKTNHCPLYGFNKVGSVVPTSEIVDLETFVKEIHEDPEKETKEKLAFLKIGRTTGLTDDGCIDTSFQKLFVKRDSFPSEKLCTSAMAHTPFQYCINCKPFDITEAELVKDKYDKQECPNCKNKLEKGEVYSLWQHNCFVVRKRGKPFGERGDSGSLIFDNRGRAWGLLHAGMFSYGDIDITLGSPLSVALKALEKKCGKTLKFWSVTARYEN